MNEIAEKVRVLRAAGLHASADALERKMTCRTCVHLDTDARSNPCATCRDFERWESTDGVQGMDEAQGEKR